MKVLRAFIAINLSPEIYQGLKQVAGQLEERLLGAPIRWVPVDNIHLTVRFLGNVSISNLDLLTKILEVEASQHPTFEISAGELGAYPSIRRPRVIWIGIEAPAELNTLQRGIEKEVARLGYAREKRAFSPHLTLGRVSRNADSNDIRKISEVLCNCKVGFLGAVRVRDIHLYRSDLQPGGAIYTRLFTAPLSLSG